MTVTTVMDGATLTAMDGTTAMQWQWKAQQQRNSNDGNGWWDGDSDGGRDGNAMPMTVMDGAIVTAMDSAMATQRQHNSNRRHDGNAMAMMAMDGATATAT
jgi:hypothetical protein